MKRIHGALAFVVVAVLFVGCGHEHSNNTHTHDGKGDHPHDDSGCGHDHSGEKHPMGQVDVGDGYRLEVAHIGPFKGGNEVICEIVVKKDGKEIKDADVTCQVKTETDDVTMAVGAAWSNDENLYDGHIDLPDTLPEGSHLVVRVRHDGKDLSHEFELEGHDHE